jgi:tRNA G18 (ribose-2'-O)-methylase SpoU
MPVSVAIVNFASDGNIAFVIRAAACFGAKNIYVIGNTNLNRSLLQDLSGSTLDFVNLVFFQDPMEFLNYSRKRDIKLVSMEIIDQQFSVAQQQHWLPDYKFDFSRKENCIVVGSETTGVPVEVIKNSDVVAIPMSGPSYCLNTSQTCNIALYVASTQFSQHEVEEASYEATRKFGW